MRGQHHIQVVGGMLISSVNRTQIAVPRQWMTEPQNNSWKNLTQTCTERKTEVQRGLDYILYFTFYIHFILQITLLHHFVNDAKTEIVQNQTTPYSSSRVNFQVNGVQCCPVEHFVMMKMFSSWAVRYGSHQPHVTMKHLKCSYYD